MGAETVAPVDTGQQLPVRSVALNIPASGHPGFESMPASQSGIRFTNQLSLERQLTNQILLNGSGVTAGDVDGDGLCDLYFCGLDNANVLYRNLGHWRFQDITAEAGVACAKLDASGAAFADLDGDGDLDLVVNTLGGGTHIFLNDGKAHFSERLPPLNSRRGGTSMALADIDGDGDLDIYIANYRTVTIRDQPNTRFRISTLETVPRVVSVDGRPLTAPDLTNRFSFRITMRDETAVLAYDENGEPDLLLRNDGNGHFTPLSWTDGTFLDDKGEALTGPSLDWGLSVMFRDVNGDGTPDIYVCNDFKSPDRLWLNNGRGRFRAAPALALRQTSQSSMGIDFADINRDGWDDFLVVDMLSREHLHRLTQRVDIESELLLPGAIQNRPQYPHNTLFLNRGDGTWAQIARLAGLDSSEWSWTPIFLDVDLDGFEDLLVSNGFERDGMNADVLQQIEASKRKQKLSALEQLHLRKALPRLDTANLAFRNRGDLTFEEISERWGFHDRAVSQGMALADLDNDGDLDVIVNNLNGAAVLYRNESNAPRIAIRLKGIPPNTRGIGAKIRVLGGPVLQSQEMICGGRYLSSDDAMRVFAAGSITNELTVQVGWRSGQRSVLTGLHANRLYEIEEQRPSPKVVTPMPSVTAQNAGGPSKPLFTDASRLLQHSHQENVSDDFGVQPTLPHRFSQLGPGVAWFDVDGDGWDDLIVGTGKGGVLALFHNDAQGGFARVIGPPLDTPSPGNQSTVLGWHAKGGPTMVLAGSSIDEIGLRGSNSIRQFDLAAGTVFDAIRDLPSKPGPLALADLNGDGQLDLFVGGRVNARRFPENASSAMFRGTEAGFEEDMENTKTLAGVGLVSGAVFSDLDGDGMSELILACEWGPLKIFRNVRGKLVPWNAPVRIQSSSTNSAPMFHGSDEVRTLNDLRGLWNGVTTGDFDGDGRLDIVACNAGRNTKYERFRARPLHLFYGELVSGAGVLAIEGFEDPATRRLWPVQPFHLMNVVMPSLRDTVGTFDNYARRTLPEIYGEGWKELKELRAVCLETTLFLNRGDHFLAVALPNEAQFTMAFAVCAQDFDGDGREDIFLSQNLFAVPSDVSRLDAGRGLLLRGDGNGGFAALRGQDSGVLIYGEQRGAAACDYDGDGRVDLVVTQNNAETRLLHNTGGAHGLRVRLHGPAGNPDGIGSVLRAATAGRLGPARELHAGSGYWSQDAAVQVLGSPVPPDTLKVCWPGGKSTSSAIPAGAREVTIDVSGSVVHVR
ncbi:MAG: hypothetical protein QOF48_1642 [Verrucomicrobiota bacterium]